MTKLNYITQNNNSFENKPKIYFSCHPDDFERTFSTVCNDVFKTHDCVVFYKEDLNDSLPPETREVDLGRMNLFIFPVTTKTLRDNNLAINEDLSFAKRELKPILPIIFEENVDSVLSLYSRAEIFGDRQYLKKYSSDSTEIQYDEKLKKYLDNTLIDKDTAEKIKNTFDAYIFLSYRKKDRKYANELMHLIHKEPLFRNIAIWFDEFLIPGESFNNTIEAAMQSCKLVILLVTPSLLEVPNYIQKVEYPAAGRLKKIVLPVEKVKTDKGTLNEIYHSLPQIVETDDETLFIQTFLDAVKNYIKNENEYDSKHYYLMGLAYLNGIDVEINVDYGVEFITISAEAGLPEAMEKLSDIYSNGKYVRVDYNKALYWVREEYTLYKKMYGEEHPETLRLQGLLADYYNVVGDNYQISEYEKIIDRKTNSYYEKALLLRQKSYEIKCKVYGEEHVETLQSLKKLVGSYISVEYLSKANDLAEKCLKISRKTLGEEHIDTWRAYYYWLLVQNNLDKVSVVPIQFNQRITILNELHVCYEAYVKFCGERNSETLSVLQEIVRSYYVIGDYSTGLEYAEKLYETSCQLYGNEHLVTIDSLYTLSEFYQEISDYQNQMHLLENYYSILCKYDGDSCYKMEILSRIADVYGKMKNYEKALELSQQCYDGVCSNPYFVKNTSRLEKQNCRKRIRKCIILSYVYSIFGKQEQSIETILETYQFGCKYLGEFHPDIQHILSVMSHLGSKYINNRLLEMCIRHNTSSDKNRTDAHKYLNMIKHYSKKIRKKNIIIKIEKIFKWKAEH